jgi:hypothetical protein
MRPKKRAAPRTMAPIPPGMAKSSQHYPFARIKDTMKSGKRVIKTLEHDENAQISQNQTVILFSWLLSFV